MHCFRVGCFLHALVDAVAASAAAAATTCFSQQAASSLLLWLCCFSSTGNRAHCILPSEWLALGGKQGKAALRLCAVPGSKVSNSQHHPWHLTMKLVMADWQSSLVLYSTGLFGPNWCCKSRWGPTCAGREGVAVCNVLPPSYLIVCRPAWACVQGSAHGRLHVELAATALHWQPCSS
jgi:hypothetical protein